MSQIFLITLLSFSLLYTVLELMKRKTEISSNLTRKIAHIFSAIFVIFFYFILSRNEFILATAFFSFIFAISYLTKFFKSIHLENQKTIGEILYPISLVILGIFYFDNKFIMLSSIAIMGFSDGLSGLYNIKYKKNTIQGSFLFLIITVFAILSFYSIFYDIPNTLMVIKIIIISIIISFIEYFSYYGTDNFTVPLSSALILSFFL